MCPLMQVLDADKSSGNPVNIVPILLTSHMSTYLIKIAAQDHTKNIQIDRSLLQNRRAGGVSALI